MTETANSRLPEYKTACGGALKVPATYPHADHRGERVYFCTPAGLRLFEQNPEAFMASHLEDPFEED